MKIKHNNHDVENDYKVLKIFSSMYSHPRQVKLKDTVQMCEKLQFIFLLYIEPDSCPVEYNSGNAPIMKSQNTKHQVTFDNEQMILMDKVVSQHYVLLD